MKKQSKVQKIMHEWKTGTLHSGKGGPVVKSRRQAVAIAMSEAGIEKTHPKKHERSEGKAERKREYGTTKRRKRKSAIEGK
jgi:hypothetical protein